MPVFVIDEDIGRSIARALIERGFVVKDIRDAGLRGATDEVIYRFAQESRAVLVTADVDFGNPLRFPSAPHFGIVILRFPNEVSMGEVARQLTEQLSALREEDYASTVVVMEPGRMRIRKV